MLGKKNSSHTLNVAIFLTGHGSYINPLNSGRYGCVVKVVQELQAKVGLPFFLYVHFVWLGKCMLQLITEWTMI